MHNFKDAVGSDDSTRGEVPTLNLPFTKGERHST